MGDGKEGRPKGAVRELLSDRYKLDVDWRAVNEAFCAIATDEGGFNVEMPVGVQAFIDEMERQVPGSREPMTHIMEMARMVEDGVNWLAEHHNEPEGLAKVEMLLKYGDLMKLVPVTCDEVCDRSACRKRPSTSLRATGRMSRRTPRACPSRSTPT